MRVFLGFTLICIFFPFIITASSIFSCEAKRIAGKSKTLETIEYPIVYPTIIIDKKTNSLTHVYTEHGSKWQTNFEIMDSDDTNLIGKSQLQSDWIKLIHLKLEEKIYSIVYAGDIGNTLEFGKCY